MMLQRFLIAAGLSLVVLPQAPVATAHPHVFVDARISSVVGDDNKLLALSIVWRFDQFHTLFALSFDDITPTPEGDLDPEAQEKLARAYTDWRPPFDGFVKLSLDSEPIALLPPTEVTASLLAEGRLEIAFTRELHEPVNLGAATVEFAVYDASYYHAVSVMEPTDIAGDVNGCRATLIPFKPDAQPAEAQSLLEKLAAEEIPPPTDVGAAFADRIVLSCV